jgi:hypothetical protein
MNKKLDDVEDPILLNTAPTITKFTGLVTGCRLSVLLITHILSVVYFRSSFIKYIDKYLFYLYCGSTGLLIVGNGTSYEHPKNFVLGSLKYLVLVCLISKIFLDIQFCKSMGMSLIEPTNGEVSTDIFIRSPKYCKDPYYSYLLRLLLIIVILLIFDIIGLVYDTLWLLSHATRIWNTTIQTSRRVTSNQNDEQSLDQ